MATEVRNVVYLPSLPDELGRICRAQGEEGFSLVRHVQVGIERVLVFEKAESEPLCECGWVGEGTNHYHDQRLGKAGRGTEVNDHLHSEGAISSQRPSGFSSDAGRDG